MAYPDLYLLRHGRHLRLDPATRIVVGRKKAENRDIAKLVDTGTDIQLRHASLPGPLVLMPGGGNEAMVRLAASICAGYTRSDPEKPAPVQVRYRNSEEVITVPVLKAADFKGR